MLIAVVLGPIREWETASTAQEMPTIVAFVGKPHKVMLRNASIL